MTALPYGQSRLLARFDGSFCGATDCCNLGMNACLPGTPPRTPHQGKTRPPGASLEGKRGRRARFSAAGGRSFFQNSVHEPSKQAGTRMGVSLALAEFIDFLHGFAFFCTDSRFFARIHFWRFLTFLTLYLSLLPMKEEEEEGQKQAHGHCTESGCLKNRQFRFCYKSYSETVQSRARHSRPNPYKSMGYVLLARFARKNPKCLYPGGGKGSQ